MQTKTHLKNIEARKMDTTHSNDFRPDSYFVLFLLVVIILVYLPVAFTRYAVLDDYSHLIDAYTEGFVKISFPDGRPLAHLLVSIVYSMIAKIADLRFVRLFNIFQVCVIAVMLYRLLRSRQILPFTAVSFVLFLLSMPPIQVHVSFTVLFFSLVSMILAGVSFG